MPAWAQSPQAATFQPWPPWNQEKVRGARLQCTMPLTWKDCRALQRLYRVATCTHSTQSDTSWLQKCMACVWTGGGGGGQGEGEGSGHSGSPFKATNTCCCKRLGTCLALCFVTTGASTRFFWGLKRGSWKRGGGGGCAKARAEKTSNWGRAGQVLG